MIKWNKDFNQYNEGDRVFLLLSRGEKGNGELAVGMTFEPFDFYWTWGGPNSGEDIDEKPVAWAPLPEDWHKELDK